MTERERLDAMEREIDAEAAANPGAPAWMLALARNDIQLERDLPDEEERGEKEGPTWR